MLNNAYHPSGYLSQPTYKGCTLPSVQMNLEGGQFCCLTQGKGPHEGPGYCHKQYFSLEFSVVIIMVHPCHDLSGFIVYTDQYEDKSDLIFILEAGIYD